LSDLPCDLACASSRSDQSRVRLRA